MTQKMRNITDLLSLAPLFGDADSIGHYTLSNPCNKCYLPPGVMRAPGCAFCEARKKYESHEAPPSSPHPVCPACGEAMTRLTGGDVFGWDKRLPGQDKEVVIGKDVHYVCNTCLYEHGYDGTTHHTRRILEIPHECGWIAREQTFALLGRYD